MLRSYVIALALVACGESSPAPSDGITHDVNTAACGSIGMQCTTTCPSGLECTHDVCMQVRGDCGGFAGAPCQDTSLVCTYPTGSSAGVCMRTDEKDCVCAIAPTALGDCMAP
jgi:hypothetical protein